MRAPAAAGRRSGMPPDRRRLGGPEPARARDRAARASGAARREAAIAPRYEPELPRRPASPRVDAPTSLTLAHGGRGRPRRGRPPSPTTPAATAPTGGPQRRL